MNMPILTQTIQIADKQTSLIQYKAMPVMTTEQMAEFYGTDSVNIRKNYTRNAERFIDGKHFFKISGQELKDFASDFEVLTNSNMEISSKARSLTLWTEKGAARHAKILETDQAWDIFEQLEEVYFSVKEKSYLPVLPNFADPAEAAIAWANEYKAKQIAQEQLAITAPKAQALDTIANTANTYTIRECVKAIGGIREKDLIQLLIDRKWIYRDTTKKLQPCAQYVINGVFLNRTSPVITNAYDGQERVFLHMRVTAFGLTRITGLVNKNRVVAA